MDYSENGSYFITICAKDRKPILSKIYDVGEGLCALPKTELTEIGKKVEEAILYMGSNPSICVDKYVIMPNHIHLIITTDFGTKIHDDIPSIIQKFKSYTTHLYRKPLWQRSFYDHKIRSEKSYLTLMQYIENNPVKWAVDKYYTSSLPDA